MKSPDEGRIAIKQRIEAPASTVSAYILDFGNAKAWMVGVEEVERLGDDSYRLVVESPVGKLEPEAKVLEQSEGGIRWAYTSTIEGGGEVAVGPANGGSACVVSYTGDFRLRSRILNRAARFVGMERFARHNGERSLERLKHLMEARRY